MCGSSPAPQATDATSVATKQQEEFNLPAYLQTQAGNAMNQQSASGGLQYTSSVGPDGLTHYTATQTLSPENQALYNTMMGTKQQAGTAGGNVLQGAYGGAPNVVGTSNSLTNEMMGNYMSSISPFLTQQTEGLDNQLRNQGLMPGTPAYDNAMNTLRQNQGQTVSGAAAQFQPQAFQEAMASYQLPADMAAKLSSLGGPVDPKFINTPQATMQAANYQGAQASADQQAMEVWKQNEASKSAMVSGLMQGVGAVGGAMMMSDRRAKTDIARVGELRDGTPVYRFRYKSGGPMQIGVMAQDIEETNPDAVIEIGGVKFVNYEKATEAAARLAA